MGILDQQKIEYTTFDILQDEGVRQSAFLPSSSGLGSFRRLEQPLTTIPSLAELKEINEWPTFPQLIIKGEFVGGLDVVKEMEESGELQEMLQG